jgi:hypothetical protein
MSAKHVEPAIDLVSFNCPHCGALAHQTWCNVYAVKLDGVPLQLDPDFVQRYLNDPNVSREQKNDMVDFSGRINSGEVFLDAAKEDHYGRPVVQNLAISHCFSCEANAVWVHDRIVYPRIQGSAFVPNADLNPDIKRDFNEAASILDISPRGAAALLRLCIQKLCIQLGQPGKHLDTDIATLVKSGLDVHVQQALDIVRVVGNNAVHPGALDLRDDRAAASHLFELVNVIADNRITQPARVKALYSQVVPPQTQAAIKKRDGQP